MGKKDKTKGAGDDEFARPSEAPSGGDGWNLTEQGRDKLLLITPHREIEVKTKFDQPGQAPKTAIVADVVVINTKKPEKSEEHTDVYVFSGYVKGALRGYIDQGRRILGWLRNTEDTSKKKDKGQFYWELEDADDDDIAAARAYREAATDPLAKSAADSKSDKSKKKGKSEPEPEPKKDKGKKSKPAPEPEPPAKKKKAKK